jgi:hypothetical protein
MHVAYYAPICNLTECVYKKRIQNVLGLTRFSIIMQIFFLSSFLYIYLFIYFTLKKVLPVQSMIQHNRDTLIGIQIICEVIVMYNV